MAKIPTNKVKKAVKVAYLGQRPLLKMFFKGNIPVWTKAAEVERDALLKVGAAVWSNPELTPQDAIAFLGSDVPAPVVGGLVETLINQDKGFTLEVFLGTVKLVLNHLR